MIVPFAVAFVVVLAFIVRETWYYRYVQQAARRRTPVGHPADQGTPPHPVRSPYVGWDCHYWLRSHAWGYVLAVVWRPTRRWAAWSTSRKIAADVKAWGSSRPGWHADAPDQHP